MGRICEILRPGSEVALRHVARFQEELKPIGAKSLFVGNSDGNLDLPVLLKGSLLGKRMGVPVESGLLSVRERELLETNADFNLLVFIDFDGVLISPMQVLLSRQKATVGYRNLKSLAKIVQASDQAVFWTSRRLLGKDFLNRIGSLAGMFPFPSLLEGYGPFLGEDLVGRLEGLGDGKLVVEANKPIFTPEKILHWVIEEYQAEHKDKPMLVYCIGSSDKDREAFLRLITEHPEYVCLSAFFDTGHIIF